MEIATLLLTPLLISACQEEFYIFFILISILAVLDWPTVMIGPYGTN
jgi:hypothetical protein